MLRKRSIHLTVLLALLLFLLAPVLHARRLQLAHELGREIEESVVGTGMRLEEDGAGAAARSAADARVAWQTEELLQRGADPNFGLFPGETPLTGAARFSQERVVDVLLRAGADPNLQSEPWESPLQRAMRAGNPRIIARLVRAGARLR